MVNESTLDLTIVMPAYNESSRIGDSVLQIRDYFKGRPERWELIVVNDGSKDNTKEVAEALQREVPQMRLINFDQNGGKGRAVREGVLVSQGEFILIADADLSAAMSEYDRLWQALSKNGEAGVIGSRAIGGDDCVVKQRLLRKFSGRCFNLLVRLLILRQYSDTQCGFKLFRRAPLLDIFKTQVLDGFSFDIEILYIAQKKGYKVAEIPISWIEKEGSKVRLIKDSIHMFLDILRIKRLHQGSYGPSK